MSAPRTIALDFDGVLHPYTRGWTGPVPDDEPPVPGAREAVEAIRALGYRVAVFSCRALTLEGRDSIAAWCARHGLAVDVVTGSKPHAVLYVDDRGWRFNGSWSALTDYLREGPPRPWNADQVRTAPAFVPLPRCGLCGEVTSEVNPDGSYVGCGHATPPALEVRS